MEFILPLVVTVFLWWFSTGLVFLLIGLPQRTYRWSILGSTLAMLAALYVIVVTADQQSTLAAYLGFFAGLVVWGWLEMLFLAGLVTGMPQDAKRPKSTGWQHFRDAVSAIVYHELSLVVGGAVILALVWGSINQMSFWIFVALWCMRLSAKLNIFLGVPNFSDELLPNNMKSLKRYFKTGPVTCFYPMSVTACVGAIILLVESAWSNPADGFHLTSMMLLTSLVFLGLIEHIFMLVRFRESALWNMFLRVRGNNSAATSVP